VEHLNAIRAALRSTAPVVAIPMEGHAPICIKAKLLKGALKGVTVLTVTVLENRWLKITGKAGNVRTSCSIVPMSRAEGMLLNRLWAMKEQDKRVKVACQGILSAKEQRAMKLKAAEKAGIAELIAAQRIEKEILEKARASVFPVLTPVDAEDRQSIVESYAAFKAQRGNRKRGAVIRWTLAKLRKEKAAMVKNQCEYEIQAPVNRYARRRKVLKSKTLVLRNPKNAVKYAALIYRIGELEKQYNSVCPPIWRKWERDGEDHGYSIDSWIEKRPKDQTYSIPWGWHDGCVESPDQVDEDGKTYRTGIKRMAERLKEARADIRALTPPEDEETEELAIAA
jgi:hypothetical protein